MGATEPSRCAGLPGCVSPDAHSVPGPGSATLLAEIQHSPTHRIAFLQNPDSTVIVHESLHADLDGFDAGLPAAGVEAGMPLDEIYVIAAREQVDWNFADKLRELELQLDLDQPTSIQGTEALEGLDQSEAPSSVDELTESAPIEIPVANGAERVATLQMAACSTPAGFDWAADERWFKDNYCGNNFQRCDALDPSQKASAQYFKHSEGHYFNQSFCSYAPALMSQRYATACWIGGCTRRKFIIAIGDVQPRVIWNVYASQGKGADGKYSQWGAEITSNGGDFTGLAYFAYTN